MRPEKWNKIKALFSEAQDCTVEERSDFLSRACGDDTDLRIEVEKLLGSYDEDDGFLENSAVAEVASLIDADSTAGSGAASDQAPDRFEAGEVLNGRYEIVRLLGRGGMGEVYLANDSRIKRTVAVKVLHSDRVSSKESLRRFALETQAVSALNHPNIMTIHEFDTTSEGTVFFVAEYVDGQTLNRHVRANLDLDKALDIAMQVSSALSAAHEAGITHRDIKPENIMVRRDGYIKVLDFGLAKLIRNQPMGSDSEDPTRALQRTNPGTVMGTAAYMSPEQARGKHVDARSDLWSLGVVLYEMLTGKRPFAGETQADLLVSVLEREPIPISRLVPELPPELEWLVAKALSKNVDGRYQTSKELRADLERIKKQIEFNRGLSRTSDGGPDGGPTNEGSEDEHGSPTAGDEARPTSGGNDETAGPSSLWSSPGLQSVFVQAKAHRVGSSIIALVLLAVVSSAIYFAFVVPGRASGQIDSIAVLPFDNPGGNADLAYLSDGLSESLIDKLSQLPQLKVISRNSSFKFRGADVDVQDAATQMGARAVVTGSVSQVGDDLVIRVDIVDSLENKHLAGGLYRRKAGDLLKLQSEIAQAATEQLRLKLTDSQSNRVVDNGTENSEAFRYYLSGLVESNGSNGAADSRALEYLQQAIKLDPDFAAAYAEIAWIYVAQANGSGDPNELMPKAKASVGRALELDPDLSKAHVVQAMLNEYDFDWPAAEAQYERAIELSPNLDFARNNYAFFLSIMDRQAEALDQLEAQRIRDPINRRMAFLQKGIILTQARRFDEALRAYQDAQAVEPTREIPNFSLGYVYGGKGMYNEAAAYYRKSVDLLGGEEKYSQALVYLAATYAKIPEKRTEARDILTRIEAKSTYVSPALLAAVYSALDDNDKAMELLEKAYIKRDLLLRFMAIGYEYDGLRGDPRFVDLTRRIGLGK